LILAFGAGLIWLASRFEDVGRMLRTALPCVGVVVLGVVAVTIAANSDWSRRWFSREKKGLCPHCGYDRRGLDRATACPECGM
jgi:hypothetical protein